MLCSSIIRCIIIRHVTDDRHRTTYSGARTAKCAQKNKDSATPGRMTQTHNCAMDMCNSVQESDSLGEKLFSRLTVRARMFWYLQQGEECVRGVWGTPAPRAVSFCVEGNWTGKQEVVKECCVCYCCSRSSVSCVSDSENKEQLFTPQGSFNGLSAETGTVQQAELI